MNPTAFIFGAGRTGRGFAAQLAFLGGYDIVLVDKDKALVDSLRREGQYEVQVIDNLLKSSLVPVHAAYCIDDEAWHKTFADTTLAFVSVFGNNLQALAKSLCPALLTRSRHNNGLPLTFITCENISDAAALLRAYVMDELGEGHDQWVSHRIGFSEAIVFRTCLNAAEGQPPLTVRANDHFELPCDAGEIMTSLAIPGLKPCHDFNNQLTRKIYTYNCINAVITYLGAEKGYAQLADAANDSGILDIAMQAAAETSVALVKEFGFDQQEQQQWTHAAFAKFRNRSIPDPINRNGADPLRKLQRNDRLIGPALLALKHGIYPAGLMKGIIACFHYYDPVHQLRVSDMILEKSVEDVLGEVCGLGEKEELFILLKQELKKIKGDG